MGDDATGQELPAVSRSQKQGTDSPIESPEKARAHGHVGCDPEILVSDFVSPELGENTFLYRNPEGGTLLCQPRDTIERAAEAEGLWSRSGVREEQRVSLAV